MIKFPNLMKEFVQFKDCTKIIRPGGVEVWICPFCKDHEQGECGKVHDCKEIIYEDELDADAKLQGGDTQCGCWSEEHGINGDFL